MRDITYLDRKKKSMVGNNADSDPEDVRCRGSQVSGGVRLGK